jgi:hypothetical protein
MNLDVFIIYLRYKAEFNIFNLTVIFYIVVQCNHEYYYIFLYSGGVLNDNSMNRKF